MSKGKVRVGQWHGSAFAPIGGTTCGERGRRHAGVTGWSQGPILGVARGLAFLQSPRLWIDKLTSDGWHCGSQKSPARPAGFHWRCDVGPQAPHEMMGPASIPEDLPGAAPDLSPTVPDGKPLWGTFFCGFSWARKQMMHNSGGVDDDEVSGTYQGGQVHRMKQAEPANR